jgi:hypothetical protein
VERENETCYFKKHKGERWKDVVIADREYVEWLLYDSDEDLSSDLVDYLEGLLDEDEDA